MVTCDPTLSGWEKEKHMQVKFDKFLALTALLASAQFNTACDNKDDEPKDTEDAGLNTDAGATNSGPISSEPNQGEQDAAVSTSSSNSSSTATLDATLTRDAGSGDVALDAGDASEAGEASETSDASAATDGEEDAGTFDGGDETTSAETDAGSSTDFDDAGSETVACDLGDFADELFLLDCNEVYDTCVETSYNGVADLCYAQYYNNRANVARAFWDCYVDQEIDPCTEAAETAAFNCADAADEGICHTTVSDCAQVSATCPAVDQVYCETFLAPYNSRYIDSVLYCTGVKADGQDPGYEGCAYDFEQCVYSPSVE